MQKVILIKRGRITFYIKEESITVNDHDFQFFGYNFYALQNRKPFYDFKHEILNSSPDEFHNILDIVTTALKYDLISVGTGKPTINETDCEIRP